MRHRETERVTFRDRYAVRDDSETIVDLKRQPHRQDRPEPSFSFLLGHGPMCSIATQYGQERIAQKIALLYTRPMAFGSQLPVRLDPETERRLEIAAERTGTTKSALIRLLAKTFVENCVHDDGSVVLPPDWKKLLEPADGRSKKKSKGKG